VRKAVGDRSQAWTQEELEDVELPLLVDRKRWKLAASHGTSSLGHAIDGNPTSRYSTNQSQSPGMWVQVELPQRARLSGIILDSSRSKDDGPKSHEVRFSEDGKQWSEALSSPSGVDGSAITEISFPTRNARFIKITQTGKKPGKYWSIHELNLLGKYPN
jgi:hypothetical protein